jgi:hypothetical protein
MKSGTVIVVEWDDHCVYQGDFDPKMRTVVQTSVGFLVDKSKTSIRIAQSRRDDKTFAEVLVIDRRMLRKVRKA